MIQKFTITAAMLILAGGLTAQVSNSKYEPNKTKTSPNSTHETAEDSDSITWTSRLPNIEARADEADLIINLNDYTSFLEGSGNPVFSATVVDTDVAEVMEDTGELTINFNMAGQTYVIASAKVGYTTIADTFAIGVRPVHSRVASVSTFDDLELEPDSYWNGNDASGGFQSGDLYFFNTYDPDWLVWTGWAYSNVVDDTTNTWFNQYAAYSNVRLDSADGTNYALSFIFGQSNFYYPDSINREIAGFYVCNTTLAALAMKNGDEYAKKFGGADGNDPDFYKLTISGFNTDGDSSGVEFYLADYRDDDNSKDYIVETWQWVDLSSLGAVFELTFELSSSDVGDWGMNTPAYFCIDNIVTSYPTAVEKKSSFSTRVYPNPSNGLFRVETGRSATTDIAVYDITGRKLIETTSFKNNGQIDISDQKAGAYFVKISSVEGIEVLRIIKR